MTSWWVDKVLPGLVTSSICAAVMWLSHRKTRRHIDAVTARQNQHIEDLTAGQTRELSARRTLVRPEKKFLDEYRGPRPRPPEGQ